MADRLTVQQFLDALRAQSITPLVDTPAVRASVDNRARVFCVGYPIQDRWPVLDLEAAYEQTLNDLPNRGEVELGPGGVPTVFLSLKACCPNL
ncbi:hypothetical protein [Paraburkholderia sp. DGU8]|jgi:hypothetical protein|uniref:hypothetical protein n=1 Tax=Paraburkholderia sp. DGU8 TaxID=3161997 RepID=UPI0034651DAF